MLLDSKNTRIFWNLLVLQRLEDLVEKEKQTLEKQGIVNLVDLLAVISGGTHALQAYLACGAYQLPHYAREKLTDLFDPDFIERDHLQKSIEKTDYEIKRLRRTRLPEFSIDHHELRLQEIDEAENKLSEFKTNFAALGHRNTVDSSMWRYPEEKELYQLGVFEKNEPRLYKHLN